ncbi:MAG TPA: phosphate signaling complex protein PhoU [Anaerolineae bacterium]|nr:phosphate signaling complex protein PhoU [Anaerolineae bacterium]
MVRQVFHEQIRELLEDLLEMGQMVADSIDRSIQSLAEQNEDLAHQVIDFDDEINATQHDIDEKCLVLIATQQPMAGDLRAILAVSNIAAELERIGDYTEGIARLALKLAGKPLLKPLIDIPRMAKEGRRMLLTSLEAFAHQDIETAAQIGKADDVVDGLYDQVYRELLVFMMEDPRTITQATYLLWVAHNLERIADRTTNIAERVIFMDSGRIVDLNR